MPILGLIHGTATFSGDSWHVSVTGAMPFSAGQLNPSLIAPQFLSPMVFVGGFKRFAENAGVMMETMVFAGPTVNEGAIVFPGIGVRLFGEHLTFDLAIFQLVTLRGLPIGGIPIPYLDFTWNF